MKFYEAVGMKESSEELGEDYRRARAFGVVRTGESCLFFRKGLRHYMIPYRMISRCYRRVMLVPLKLCCGRGEMAVEHLVVETDGVECAVIQLPGTKEAKLLMEELKIRIPHAEFVKPDKGEKRPDKGGKKPDQDEVKPG